MTTDYVNKPPHYRDHPSGVECIEVTQLLSFTLGNAVKYIWRAWDKNGLEDLRKARWYLQKHLAMGWASWPPHKARKLLEHVCDLDNNEDRARMLRLISLGDLEGVIAGIDWIAP